eukprot:UN01166
MKVHTLCVVLLIALICSAFYTTTAEAQSAGLITSISATSISNIANKIIPIAMQKIRELEIPNMSEGHITFSDIRIKDLGVEGFSISTDDSALVVSLNRLYVNVHVGTWRYKTKLFSTHGHADARASVSTTLRASLVPDNGRFSLQLPGNSVSVDDFHISIGGGLLAKVLNAIKSLFNGAIRRAVASAVEPQIRNALYDMASRLSDSIPVAADTAFGTISFAPAAFGVSYANGCVSVAFNGNVNGAEPERHAIENSFAPSGALFDIVVDTFLFNSAFIARDWRVNVYNADHPGSFEGVVPGWNTNDWSSLLPELASKYPNQAVTINLSMLEKPVMTSTAGVLSVRVIGGFEIMANDQRVALIRAELIAGVSVAINAVDGKYYIVAQLAAPSMTFTTVESQIGNLDFGLLNVILGIASQLITAGINDVLAQGLLIPSVTGMSLSNPQFAIFEGGFRFGTDINIDF